MRTKPEIAKILAKKKFSGALSASNWGDFVSSIQSFTAEEKDILVKLIANGNAKKAGERLKRALHDNARARAEAEVDTMLSNDALSLAEIDALI